MGGDEGWHVRFATVTGLRVVEKRSKRDKCFSVTLNHGDLLPLTGGRELYNNVDVMEGKPPWKDTEELARGP